MSNTRIWDAVKTPPPDALKEIKGGRLAGKTDIDPVWRLQAMTELFGPVGEGWSFTIDKLWTEPGSDGQVACFAQVSLYYHTAEATGSNNVTVGRSAPIPGIGGSMLVTKERNGLHTNDEGFKMAVTDALSVAMKALGVAADVYRGKMDGSKYKDKPEAPKPAPAASAPTPAMTPIDTAGGNALAQQMARDLKKKFDEATAVQHLENIKTKHAQSLALIKEHVPALHASLKELYQARMTELRSINGEPPPPTEEHS